MPTINEEIVRLNKAKQDIKKSIEDKGVTVGDGTIDTYSAKIDEISTGIEPTGTIEITQNGTYDVTTYASANVNTPSATLGTKDITENGTYNATDDNLDGYSQVSVNVAGAGVDEYFRTTYQSKDSDGTQYYLRKYLLLKQPPNFTIPTGVISLTNLAREYKQEFLPKIICSNTVIATDLMFYACESSNIDVSGLDTSNVTNMKSMFSGCNKITSLPTLTNLNTSKVTNMSQMFYGCGRLKSLNLSNFDTSKVTNMNNMFARCTVLDNLDLSSFDTSNVTDMSQMFYACQILRNLTFGENFDTSKVTNMKGMFSNCQTATTFDLSKINISNVTDIGEFFYSDYALKTLDFSSWNSVDKISGMDYMFYDCRNLTTIDLSNITINTSFRSPYMFSGCTKLENLNISNIDLTKCVNYNSMFANVPVDCYILVKNQANKEWITSKFTNLTNVHYVGE